MLHTPHSTSIGGPHVCVCLRPCACVSVRRGKQVSFHGCKQSTSNIQNQYVADTGLNNWAETNNIIVLYPQVVPSYVSPANPDGCWDWVRSSVCGARR